jgi:hypothetical protein
MIRDWLVPPQVRYALRVARGRERPAQAKRFVRDVVNWVVPVAVQSVLLGARYSLAGVDVGANARLQDRHRGARCFVIGNGASLGAMDLRPLAGEITIGANSFYKHPQAQLVGLKYLCIGDPSFMSDEEKNVVWHRTIEQQQPGAVLMLQADARKLVARHGLYSRHEVHYFRRGVTMAVPEAIQLDFTKPINVGSTTGTTLCIPLAIYMGCKEILLIGFDANWLDNYSGSYHFYPAHELYPEFDSPQADSRWPRYEDQLLEALRDFESHRLLATRASQIGVTIRNAGVGGRLDMYPRVDYQDVVSCAGARQAR